MYLYISYVYNILCIYNNLLHISITCSLNSIFFRNTCFILKIAFMEFSSFDCKISIFQVYRFLLFLFYQPLSCSFYYRKRENVTDLETLKCLIIQVFFKTILFMLVEVYFLFKKNLHFSLFSLDHKVCFGSNLYVEQILQRQYFLLSKSAFVFHATPSSLLILYNCIMPMLYLKELHAIP